MSGFTLIEVMVVVLIIGILSSLAYAGLMDLAFSNRAKETAQTMRTFAEKSVMESKRLGRALIIRIDGNNIVADTIGADTAEFSRMALSGGFSASSAAISNAPTSFNSGVQSDLKLGVSGITTPGYFAACGARGYCGAAAKIANENSFKAYIKKGTNATSWEPL